MTFEIGDVVEYITDRNIIGVYGEHHVVRFVLKTEIEACHSVISYTSMKSVECSWVKV